MPPPNDPTAHAVQKTLRDLLHDNFSNDDLKEVCFEIGLDWDDIKGEDKRAKTRELVQHYAKREQLHVLRDAMAEARPNLRDALSAITLPSGEDTNRAAAPPRAPSHWHYPYSHYSAGNFTGRADERKRLDQWLREDTQHPLFVLRALGGFGKSELAWHWLTHDLDPAAAHCPLLGAMWWGFYENSANFSVFVAEALKYAQALGVRFAPLKSEREQVEALLEVLAEIPLLLVMDGFERELRAYNSLNAAYLGDGVAATTHAYDERGCIDPLAEHFLRRLCSLPKLRGKVLMTTRLRPSACEQRGMLLAGCHEAELRQLAPADAVALFRAAGVRGIRAEIEQACRQYGYHPLSLRLLLSNLANDPRQPNDIAAAKGYDLSGDLVQRQNHVLARAYDGLGPSQQRLLGYMAALRSAVEYDVLRQLLPDSPTLNADLARLIQSGLLQRDAAGPASHSARYDLHPIVRRYAYDRLHGDARTQTHSQLRNYFEAVPEPDKVHSLADLAPAIELYHHLIGGGQFDQALELFDNRLKDPLSFQLGAYQTVLELLRGLFPTGEAELPRLSNESAQAWVMNEMGVAYSLSGQSRQAAQMKRRHNDIRERQNDKKNLAIGLDNLTDDLHKLGQLREAEAAARRSIALCQEIEDHSRGAVGQQQLGQGLTLRGTWNEASQALTRAFEQWEKENDSQGKSVVSALCAQHALGLARLAGGDPAPHLAAALQAAQAALDFSEESARQTYPTERDYVQAYRLLGAAQRLAGQHALAEQHLTHALSRCRRINLVELEADILIDLARLRAAQGDAAAANDLLNEAWDIAERCEDVIQGADAQLELAYLARQRGDLAAARDHARHAHRLATCDGPPDYTYKVAYELSAALLRELGES